MSSAARNISKPPVINETTKLLSSNKTNVNGKGDAHVHTQVDLETQFSLDGASHSHESPVIGQSYQQHDEPSEVQEEEQQPETRTNSTRYSKPRFSCF